MVLFTLLWDRATFCLITIFSSSFLFLTVSKETNLGVFLTDSVLFSFLQGFFSTPLPIFFLLFLGFIVSSWHGIFWFPLVFVSTKYSIYNISELTFGPQGLINGLVLIHPPVLFLTYLILINNLDTRYSIFRPYLFSKKINNFTLRGMYYSFFALLLGSIWAQQELNWGGWWGWDLVEFGALFFFLFFIHECHKPHWFYESVSFSRILTLFLLFFYISLHWGLLESVHAFVNPSELTLPCYILVYLVFFLNFIKPSFFKNNLRKFFFYKLFFIFLTIFFSTQGYNFPISWLFPILVFTNLIFIAQLNSPLTLSLGFMPVFVNFINTSIFIWLKSKVLHSTFLIFLFIVTVMNFKNIIIVNSQIDPIYFVCGSFNSFLAGISQSYYQKYFISSTEFILRLDWFNDFLYSEFDSLFTNQSQLCYNIYIHNFITILKLHNLVISYIILIFGIIWIFSLFILIKKHP